MLKEYLILRLDAPLMSFGAPLVDNHGKTESFLTLSALTGLLANSLGYDHSEGTKIQCLQSRIRYAVRCDRKGRMIQDFQTVFLGQSFLLKENAWTTWSKLDVRKGGPEAQKGTHIRYRDYIADSVYTVSMCLEPLEECPTLADIAFALMKPARPLFIGRKACLPSAPLLMGEQKGENPLDALLQVPAIETSRRDSVGESIVSAWWAPADGGACSSNTHEALVADQRDWCNQVHTGQRLLRQGIFTLKEAGNE